MNQHNARIHDVPIGFEQLTPREASRRMKEVHYPDFDAINLVEEYSFDRPIKPQRKRIFRDELQVTTVDESPYIHNVAPIPPPKKKPTAADIAEKRMLKMVDTIDRITGGTETATGAFAADLARRKRKQQTGGKKLRAKEEIDRVALMTDIINQKQKNGGGVGKRSMSARPAHETTKDILSKSASASFRESNSQPSSNVVSHSTSASMMAMQSSHDNVTNHDKNRNRIDQNTIITPELLSEWRADCDELVIALHAIDDDPDSFSSRQKKKTLNTSSSELNQISVRTGGALLRSSIAAGVISQNTANNHHSKKHIATVNSQSQSNQTLAMPSHHPDTTNNVPHRSHSKSSHKSGSAVGGVTPLELLKAATCEDIAGAGEEYGGEDRCSPVKFPLTSLAKKTGRPTFTFGPPGDGLKKTTDDVNPMLVGKNNDDDDGGGDNTETKVHGHIQADIPSLKVKLDCYEMPKYVHHNYHSDNDHALQHNSSGGNETNKKLNSTTKKLHSTMALPPTSNSNVAPSTALMNNTPTNADANATESGGPVINSAHNAHLAALAAANANLDPAERSRRRLAAFLGSDQSKPDFTQPSNHGGVGTLLGQHDLKNSSMSRAASLIAMEGTMVHDDTAIGKSLSHEMGFQMKQMLEDNLGLGLWKDEVGSTAAPPLDAGVFGPRRALLGINETAPTFLTEFEKNQQKIMNEKQILENGSKNEQKKKRKTSIDQIDGTNSQSVDNDDGENADNDNEEDELSSITQNQIIFDDNISEKSLKIEDAEEEANQRIKLSIANLKKKDKAGFGLTHSVNIAEEMPQALYSGLLARDALNNGNSELAMKYFGRAADELLEGHRDLRKPESVFRYSEDIHIHAKRIQKPARKFVARRHFGAILIQATFRGFLVRYDRVLFLRRASAAQRKIARPYRGHLSKLLPFRMLIQRSVRGLIGRFRYKNRILWFKRLCKIQALFHSKLAIKKVNYLRFRTKMANTILRNWRGFSIRLCRARNIEQHHFILSSAVTCISKIMRGYISRKDVLIMKKACKKAEALRTNRELIAVKRAVNLVLMRTRNELETPEGRWELEEAMKSLPHEEQTRAKELAKLSPRLRERGMVLDIFNRFDIDGSGSIEIEEMPELLHSLGVLSNKRTDAEIDLLVRKMDKDKNGAICFEEFFNWYQSPQGSAARSFVYRNFGITLNDLPALKERCKRHFINKRTKQAALEAMFEFRELEEHPRFCCMACRKPFALFGDYYKHLKRDQHLFNLIEEEAKKEAELLKSLEYEKKMKKLKRQQKAGYDELDDFSDSEEEYDAYTSSSSSSSTISTRKKKKVDVDGYDDDSATFASLTGLKNSLMKTLASSRNYDEEDGDGVLNEENVFETQFKSSLGYENSLQSHHYSNNGKSDHSSNVSVWLSRLKTPNARKRFLTSSNGDGGKYKPEERAVMRMVPKDRCCIKAHERGILFSDLKLPTVRREIDRQNTASIMYTRWLDEDAAVTSATLNAIATCAVDMKTSKSVLEAEMNLLASHLYLERKKKHELLRKEAAANDGFVLVDDDDDGNDDDGGDDNISGAFFTRRSSIGVEDVGPIASGGGGGGDSDSDWDASDYDDDSSSDYSSRPSTRPGSSRPGSRSMKERVKRKMRLEDALMLEDARQVFHVFDTDGNGTINHEEFRNLVDILGITLTPPEPNEKADDDNIEHEDRIDENEAHDGSKPNSVQNNRHDDNATAVTNASTITSFAGQTIEMISKTSKNYSEYSKASKHRKKLGISKKDKIISDTLAMIDEDSSGDIDYHEFKKWFIYFLSQKYLKRNYFSKKIIHYSSKYSIFDDYFGIGKLLCQYHAKKLMFQKIEIESKYQTIMQFRYRRPVHFKYCHEKWLIQYDLYHLIEKNDEIMISQLKKEIIWKNQQLIKLKTLSISNDLALKKQILEKRKNAYNKSIVGKGLKKMNKGLKRIGFYNLTKVTPFPLSNYSKSSKLIKQTNSTSSSTSNTVFVKPKSLSKQNNNNQTIEKQEIRENSDIINNYQHQQNIVRQIMKMLKLPEPPPKVDELKIVSSIAEKRMLRLKFQTDEMQIKLAKELIRVKAHLLKHSLEKKERIQQRRSQKPTQSEFNSSASDLTVESTQLLQQNQSSTSLSITSKLTHLLAQRREHHKNLQLLKKESIIEEVQYYLDLFDVSSNGNMIDIEDLISILKCLCIPTWSKNKMFRIQMILDEKKDGNISKALFMKWFCDEGIKLRMSIDPIHGGSPLLVPAALFRRKMNRRAAGGRAHYDARLKLIAKARGFARAKAVEKFAFWMEEQQRQGGKTSDLANQLLQQDPGLLRLLSRRQSMLPRMLADEAEALVIQAEVLALKKHKRFLSTRPGVKLLQSEESLVRSYRNALHASVAGIANKQQRELALARHCFQLYDTDCSGTIESGELQGLLGSLGVPCREEEVLLLTEHMDKDGSGSVDYDEFADWFVQEGLMKKEQEQERRRKNSKSWLFKKKTNKLVFDHELQTEEGIHIEAKCSLKSNVVVKARSDLLASIAKDEEKKSAVGNFTSILSNEGVLMSPFQEEDDSANQIVSSVINPLEYPEVAQMQKLMNKVIQTSHELDTCYHKTLKFAKMALIGKANSEKNIQIEKQIIEYKLRANAIKTMMKREEDRTKEQEHYSKSVQSNHDTIQATEVGFVNMKNEQGMISGDQSMVEPRVSMMSSMTSMSSQGTPHGEEDSFLAGINDLNILKSGDPFAAQQGSSTLPQTSISHQQRIVSSVLNITQNGSLKQGSEDEGSEVSTWHGGPRAPYPPKLTCAKNVSFGDGENQQKQHPQNGLNKNYEQQNHDNMRKLDATTLALEEEMAREMRPYEVGEPVLVRRLGRPRKLSEAEMLEKSRKKEEAEKMNEAEEEELRKKNLQSNNRSTNKTNDASKAPAGNKDTQAVATNVEEEDGKTSAVAADDEVSTMNESQKAPVTKLPDAAEGWEFTWVVMRGIVIGREKIITPKASFSLPSVIEENKTEGDQAIEIAESSETKPSEPMDGDKSEIVEESNKNSPDQQKEEVEVDNETERTEHAWDYTYSIRFPEEANEMKDDDPNIHSIHSWQGGRVGMKNNSLMDSILDDTDDDSSSVVTVDASQHSIETLTPILNPEQGSVVGDGSVIDSLNQDDENASFDNESLNSPKLSVDNNSLNTKSSVNEEDLEEESKNMSSADEDQSESQLDDQNSKNASIEIESIKTTETNGQKQNETEEETSKQNNKEEEDKSQKIMDEISFDSVFSLTLEKVDSKLMRRLPREVLAMERRAARAAVARAEVEKSAKTAATACQEVKKCLRKIQQLCSRKHRIVLANKLKDAYRQQKEKRRNEKEEFLAVSSMKGAAAAAADREEEKENEFVENEYSEQEEEEEEEEIDDEEADENFVSGGLSYELMFQDMVSENSEFLECIFNLVHRSLDPNVFQLSKDLEIIGSYASATAFDAQSTHPTSVSSVQSWGQGCVSFDEVSSISDGGQGLAAVLKNEASIYTHQHTIDEREEGHHVLNMPAYLRLPGGMRGVGEVYGPIMAVNSLRVIGQCCFRNRTAADLITRTHGFEEMISFGLEETRRLIAIKQSRSLNQQVKWMLGGATSMVNNQKEEEEEGAQDGEKEADDKGNCEETEEQCQGIDCQDESSDEEDDAWLNSVITNANEDQDMKDHGGTYVFGSFHDLKKKEPLNHNEEGGYRDDSEEVCNATESSPSEMKSGSRHHSLSKTTSAIRLKSVHPDLIHEPKLSLEITNQMLRIIENAADCSWNAHPPLIRVLGPFLHAINQSHGKTLPIAINKQLCMTLVPLAHNRKSRKTLEPMVWVLDSLLSLPDIVALKTCDISKPLTGEVVDNINNIKVDEEEDAILDSRSFATLSLAILTIPEKESESGNVIDDVELRRNRDGEEDETLMLHSSAEATNNRSRPGSATTPRPSSASASTATSTGKVASASSTQTISKAAIIDTHRDNSIEKMHPALMTLSHSTPLLNQVCKLLSKSLHHSLNEKYISTSWKVCSVISRLCRIPIFRAQLMILGCLPLLCHALLVGTKLMNLKNEEKEYLSKTEIKDEKENEIDQNKSRVNQSEYVDLNRRSNNLTDKEKEADITMVLSGARGVTSWSRGEPTTMAATIGWLQRYACEALLNIGQDPHILEELRVTNQGVLLKSIQEISNLTPSRAAFLQCSMPNEYAKTSAMTLLSMLEESQPSGPRQFAMLARAECVYSAEIIQFLNIAPAATCLPKSSDQFKKFPIPKMQKKKQFSKKLSFYLKQKQENQKHTIKGKGNEIIQVREESFSNMKNNEDVEDVSAEIVTPTNNQNIDSNSNNQSAMNEQLNNNLQNESHEKLLLNNNNDNQSLISTSSTKIMKMKLTQRKLIEQELNSGYGYIWLSKPRVFHNNYIQFEPSKLMLLKDVQGEISPKLAQEFLFNMGEISGRTLFREGLKVFKAWQLRQRAAEKMIKLHWFDTTPNFANQIHHDDDSNDVDLNENYDPATIAALACFWLDVHYCIFLHNNEAASPSKLNLTMDVLELKYLIRKLAVRYDVPELNESLSHLIKACEMNSTSLFSSSSSLSSAASSSSSSSSIQHNVENVSLSVDSNDQMNSFDGNSIDSDAVFGDLNHIRECKTITNFGRFHLKESVLEHHSLPQSELNSHKNYCRFAVEDKIDKPRDSYIVSDDELFCWLCKQIPMKNRRSFFTTKTLIPPSRQDDFKSTKKTKKNKQKINKNEIIFGTESSFMFIKKNKINSSSFTSSPSLSSSSSTFSSLLSSSSSFEIQKAHNQSQLLDLYSLRSRISAPNMWRLDAIDAYFARGRDDGRSEARNIDNMRRGLKSKYMLYNIDATQKHEEEEEKDEYEELAEIEENKRKLDREKHANAWRLKNVSSEKFVRYVSYAEEEASANGCEFLETSHGKQALIKTGQVITNEGNYAIHYFLAQNKQNLMKDFNEENDNNNNNEEEEEDDDLNHFYHNFAYQKLNDKSLFETKIQNSHSKKNKQFQSNNTSSSSLPLSIKPYLLNSSIIDLFQFSLYPNKFIDLFHSNKYKLKKLEIKKYLKKQLFESRALMVWTAFSVQEKKMDLKTEKKIKNQNNFSTKIMSSSSSSSSSSANSTRNHSRNTTRPNTAPENVMLNDENENNLTIMKDAHHYKSLSPKEVIRIANLTKIRQNKKNKKVKNSKTMNETSFLTSFKKSLKNTNKSSNLTNRNSKRFSTNTRNSKFQQKTSKNNTYINNNGDSLGGIVFINSEPEIPKVAVGIDRLEFPHFLQRFCQIVPGSFPDYSSLISSQAFDLLPISNDLIYFNQFLIWYYATIENLSNKDDNNLNHHHSVMTTKLPSVSTSTYLTQLSYWNTTTQSKRISLLSADRLLAERRRRARVEIRRHFNVAQDLNDFIERCKNWEE